MKTITYDETKWKLVPFFPDVNMTGAGMDHVLSGQDYERAQGCWKAMLAAAPTPAADGQAQQDADKADAEPTAYLRESDLERLAKPYVAGCAASLSKEPGDGFVAIYTDAARAKGGQS